MIPAVTHYQHGQSGVSLKESDSCRVESDLKGETESDRRAERRPDEIRADYRSNNPYRPFDNIRSSTLSTSTIMFSGFGRLGVCEAIQAPGRCALIYSAGGAFEAIHVILKGRIMAPQLSPSVAMFDYSESFTAL